MINQLFKHREKYVFVVDERVNELDNRVLFPEKLKMTQDILAKGGYPTSKKREISNK